MHQSLLPSVHLYPLWIRTRNHKSYVLIQRRTTGWHARDFDVYGRLHVSMLLRLLMLCSLWGPNRWTPISLSLSLSLVLACFCFDRLNRLTCLVFPLSSWTSPLFLTSCLPLCAFEEFDPPPGSLSLSLSLLPHLPLFLTLSTLSSLPVCYCLAVIFFVCWNFPSGLFVLCFRS